MTLLVLGVALWWLAHLFPRIAPAAHDSMGDRARPAVTGALVIAVLLMIFGYRGAVGPFWWGPTSATVGITNLLVLFAIYLFASSGMKTGINRYIRHPQLLAVLLWAVGHLLVNGDLPSLILFGGLGLWAIVEMVLLSREGWTRPAHPVPIKKEIIAVVAAVVTYAAIGMIHAWLGYWPFSVA